MYAALGALQMDLDRFEDAANSYRIVLKHEPENQKCKSNLEICEQKLSEAKKPPKPSPILVKAIMLHMEGKIEEAIKELQRGVKAGEKAVDVYAGLGHLQFEAGRFEAAADAYREVLAREPLHKTCHYNLAVCLEKTGRHKEALTSFEKGFEINSQRAEIGIGVGVSLLHLRRFAEAVTAFETCSEDASRRRDGGFRESIRAAKPGPSRGRRNSVCGNSQAESGARGGPAQLDRHGDRAEERTGDAGILRQAPGGAARFENRAGDPARWICRGGFRSSLPDSESGSRKRRRMRSKPGSISGWPAAAQSGANRQSPLLPRHRGYGRSPSKRSRVLAPRFRSKAIWPEPSPLTKRR